MLRHSLFDWRPQSHQGSAGSVIVTRVYDLIGDYCRASATTQTGVKMQRSIRLVFSTTGACVAHPDVPVPFLPRCSGSRFLFSGRVSVPAEVLFYVLTDCVPGGTPALTPGLKCRSYCKKKTVVTRGRREGQHARKLAAISLSRHHCSVALFFYCWPLSFLLLASDWHRIANTGSLIPEYR